MIYLWATLLTLLNAVGVGLTVFGLPGNWLMVIATGVVVWWQWGGSAGGGTEMFSVWTLLALLVIAAIAEAAEFLTGAVGTKATGGTKAGSIGALIGGIVGGIAATFLIPVPIFGSLIGACIGAGLGAVIGELATGRKLGDSTLSGVGAGMGTFAGRVLKLGAGLVMWIIATVAAFWP